MTIPSGRRETSGRKEVLFGLIGYEIFLAVVAFLGWTLVAMDLNIFSTTLPQILTSFNIPTSYSGFITSAVFAGMAVLQFLLSPLIEYLGRKLMFNLTLLGTAIFTGLTIFASNVFALIGVRIAADGFSYSEFPAGLTIVQEGVPGSKRGAVYGFVQAGFPVGFFLAAVATSAIVPVYGWRAVYLVGVLPAVVVMIARSWVKEPDRYKVFKEIRELAKRGQMERQRRSSRGPLSNRIPSKPLSSLRRQNLILTVAEFLHEFSTPTLLFFTAVILEDYKGLSASQALFILALSTAIAAFAYFIAGLLGNMIRHGRKWVAAGSTILGGIFSIPFIYLTGFYPLLLSSVLWIPVLLSWNGSWWTYVSESNPTRARGTAGGYINAVSTVSWIVSSALWSVAVPSIGLAPWWILGGAVVAILAGIVLLFGRTIEPKKELEEISF
jgi:putative MFS transporter